jgi:hypothetical protein
LGSYWSEGLRLKIAFWIECLLIGDELDSCGSYMYGCIDRQRFADIGQDLRTADPGSIAAPQIDNINLVSGYLKSAVLPGDSIIIYSNVR